MSRHDSNSYSCFITMFTFTPTLHTPLSPSVLHRHRACHCSEQRNLVNYHSDNVVISLSGAESTLGYSYVYLPHHHWVSQEGEIFRRSSPDTRCHPPHSAYYTYNSSELWHAINKHGILIFFFIRKIAQLIETLHKIGHYRGLVRLIWKLMSVNVIIWQEYSPFLILLKWCHHKIQIQINNDVQSLVPDKIKNCDDNKNKNQVAHKINN